MKVLRVIFMMMLMLVSCNSKDTMSKSSNHDDVTKRISFDDDNFIDTQDLSGTDKADSIFYVRMRGRREQTKFLQNHKSQEEIIKLVSNPIHIVAFHLNCDENGEGGNVFLNRISQGVPISIDDFTRLRKSVNSPNAMNAAVSACFSPQLGLVLYDDDGMPFGHVEICLLCNQINFHPKELFSLGNENTPFIGFSKELRDEIRDIFIPYGFTELEFENVWDRE